MTATRLTVAALVVLMASAFLSWSNLVVVVTVDTFRVFAAAGLALLCVSCAWLACATTPAERVLVCTVALVSSLLFLIGLWLVVVFLAALGMGVSAVGALHRPWRRLALGAMLLFAAVVVGTSVGDPLGRETWLARLARVPQPGAQLVRAIGAFERENGTPPAQLAELVPRYLKTIPGTGLGDWGEGANWSYLRAPFLAETEKQSYGKNAWVLQVHTGRRGRGFLRIMYLPDQRYPAGTTRAGGWAIGPF